MEDRFEKRIILLLIQRKQQKRLVALFLCLAMLIGTGVFAALSQEGIAMTRVERVLDCHFSATEGEGYAGYAVHVHNADCCNEAGELLCPLPEIYPHTHEESCYRTETLLSCGLEETVGHQHDETCYTLTRGSVLCGLDEGPGHSHDADCYTLTQGALICGQEENEEHQHNAACYEWDDVLTCGQEEYAGHTHTDACYEWISELTCGREEGEGAHQHSDACCETVTKLICGRQEPHTHTPDCYDETGARICGLLQLEEHVHGPGCFIETVVEDEIKEELKADEPDPNADVETWWDYAAHFETMDRSGAWNEVLVAVAKTQLGYTESERNFIFDENGQKQKYTRYGAWYGIPYGDWCAMFVSFCLYFADIPAETFPVECGVTRWIDDLRAKELYASADGYMPKLGDVIFFDFNEDGLGDHAGIVSMVNEDAWELETVEGNRTERVDVFRYALSDPTIMGYGVLPDRPEEAIDDAEGPETVAEPENGEESETAEDLENEPNPETETGPEHEDEPETQADSEDGKAVLASLDLGLAVIETESGEALPAALAGHAYSLAGDEAGAAQEAVEVFLAERKLPELPMNGPRRMTAAQAATVSPPAEDAAENVRSETRYQSFDIGLDNLEGAAFEGGFRVSVTLPETVSGRDFRLYHVGDAGVEELTVELQGVDLGDGTERVSGFSFVTPSFSPFVLSYTVDFRFGEYALSIAGESELMLSALFAALDIREDAASVLDVRFSDPELLAVEALDGDWRLTSLQPFTTEETLTVIFQNGTCLEIAVTDAQHVEELAFMLESAAVYENGNLIPWPATVRENKMYDIRLTFKENSVYQFLDTADEMYYPVPEGLDLGDEDFTHDFSMDVGDGVKLEGNTVKYDAATKRFVVKWNTEDKTAFNKLIASNSAEFRLDFKAKFDFTKDTVEFSENVSGKVIKDTSYDVDVEKTGVYNEDEDRIDYTVTVTSYGDSKDVKVKDELFGTALSYLSTGDNHGVSWKAYDKDGNPTTNDTIGSVQVLKTNKETYPDREAGLDCGFEVTVGSMADGEKIEFTYSAAVEYDKLTGSGTYEETFNKVVVTTPSGEKEKDHSFTGSLHYVKLQKDHERPINWNGDNATVTWFITVNEEFKVGMKNTVISDRIYAGDVEAMDYSGDGLHVAVYDEDGALVGAYDVPWEDSAITRNALGINPETEEIDYASWQYVIPEEQTAKDAAGNTVTIDNSEHYKYVVSYTTDTDKSLMVFDGYIGNEAKESKTDNEMQDGFYPPGTGTMPEVKKAVEPKEDEAFNAPNGSNEEYIYWVITFDRQRYDLTRCVIEDNNPTLWGNAEPVDVTVTEDGYEYLYVEGLTDSESWEVSSATDTRTTIKFYRDKEKTKPGLLRASDAYTGEDGAPSNTITIHLRTKNSKTWMEGTLTKYWPRNHTNTVTWIPNAHQVEADATATPDVRKIIKEGIQVGAIIRDGVSLPVFRYELFLVGIDENSFPDGTLVLNDVFDTEKLALINPSELTEINGFEYTQALQENMGNNRIQLYWDQKLKGYGAVNGWIGPVPVEAEKTAAGIQFTITESDFTEKGMETIDGEPVYCLRYSLPYYLAVKDAEAAQAIARATMEAGKDTAEFDNTVTWNNDPNLRDGTTVQAEFKPAQKSILYNDQRDIATYQLTLNPQGMKLNEGQMIRVEDEYENLAVDFSTVNITTVPADRASQINWSYHSNKGTFWIPDETVVIITYQAQPIGDAGKNVTIKNKLTMLTWKETVEKTVTLNSESEGSAGDYNIRLFKYKDDFMNEPLSGAIFQLFEVGDGSSGDVQRNGKWYKPATYQTAADVNSGSEEYTHTALDIIADDVFLQEKGIPTRLHHNAGDKIYFSTGANGYSDIHLSQSRDGVALERGKQYYLYEVVTPDGYDKEDIYWSFIIDDMDFFDSAHGIYQYRDGGVLTVSNESSQDKGIVISKSFTGDARDALNWYNVQFEIVGVDKGGEEVFKRDVSFADFVKYKLKLPNLPTGNGPYTYTITEKNADVATAARTTKVSVIKTSAGSIDTDGQPVQTTIVAERTLDSETGLEVSFPVTDDDLKPDSETAFKVAFENNYVEKPVELTLNKEWGTEAAKLTNKTLTLALFKEGEEYGLYQDGGVYKPVARSEADPKPEAVRIVLNETTGWTVKVADLPRYEAGKPIAWTIKEVGASFTQDGNAISVSEADMDMQFNITASMQTGVDDKGEPVTKAIKVEHAEAPIDTTSAKEANLTLNNELSTLTTVKVEKKWYDEDGKDVTGGKTADDAVTYDLYRTTEELPKGGKERRSIPVLFYYAESNNAGTILTPQIEVCDGDVLEIEVEAIDKNVNPQSTWWAWYYQFKSLNVHYSKSPWWLDLPVQYVKNENGEIITSTQAGYDTGYYNSSYPKSEKNPKIYITLAPLKDVDYIDAETKDGKQMQEMAFRVRNWKNANITVRNLTQESENLTHAKLEQFVNEHSATTQLFRENLTLGELEDEIVKWNSVNNYPDGYTYFAIEHTPAGYEDTYSIVDDENGNEVMTIENRPIKIEEGQELGALTVQKIVTGLPDAEEYRNKEYQFRIKNGSKYLVKTGTDTYELMSIAQLTTAGKTLDADATYSIHAGSEILSFGGLYPAIYTIEEVGNPQVTGYTLETSYTGSGRIGVNLSQTSSSTITNAYTPEETQVIFGKLWADRDGKPVVWPEGQSIEVVVQRRVKDAADSVDGNFKLVYSITANGAERKDTESKVPAPELLANANLDVLLENAISPYYAYRYQLSGLSKKVLTGANAGKEWVYYVTETAPEGAAYEGGYGSLNGTAARIAEGKTNAEAKAGPTLTDTDYVVNQVSSKEITFTKNWHDGISESALSIWPQREIVSYDADGNVVPKYDTEGHEITEWEDVPITVTLRRRLAYGNGTEKLTAYDPKFEVSFSNLTSAVIMREQNTDEGKLTLRMEKNGGNFTYTISGLKEKGEMDGQSGAWRYYVIESSVDGYSAAYLLSGNHPAEGSFTDEGGTIRNTKKLGTIVVEKIAEGLPKSEKEKEFFFTVKKSTNEYLTKDGGLATQEEIVTIKAGEKAVFKNVPAGEYTVEEIGTGEDGSAQVYGYSLAVSYDQAGVLSLADDDIKTVTVTNTYRPETTDFTFTKLWYGVDWNTPTDWLTESITVTLDRSFKPTDGEEIKGEPITMTIFPQDGNSGFDYTVEKKTSPTVAYEVNIQGLERFVPKGKLPGGVASGEWTYTLAEAVPSGYYAHYFMKENEQYQGAKHIDDGGRIENHLETYELPSTGGAGTMWFYILGGTMSLFAGAILLRRKREQN